MVAGPLVFWLSSVPASKLAEFCQSICMLHVSFSLNKHCREQLEVRYRFINVELMSNMLGMTSFFVHTFTMQQDGTVIQPYSARHSCRTLI